MSMSPHQKRQKEEAMRESEHHHKNSSVDGVRSNSELSDKELENRMMGREKGTSISDEVSAGFALNNRKEKKEYSDTMKKIPERR